MTLQNAIKAAMADFLFNLENRDEGGSLTPINPAIVRDGTEYSYTSALHPCDAVIWDLQEGLGAWEPKPGDDLDAMSAGAAEMIAQESSDLLRDGVEISLERLENVDSSSPHFMFLGRHGELFATVRMHDSSTGENRIVSHEDECKDESERMAYRTCLERGVAIAIGITVAEPVRDVETHPCPVLGEVVCVSDPVAAKA